MTDQITVPRETWDAMREALERVQGDINWMLNMRQFLNGHVFDYVEEALTAANAVSAEQYSIDADPQGIAWEATTSGYIKYVTDKQYRSFSETAKRWYKPYKCRSCHPQATEPAGYKLVPVELTPEMIRAIQLKSAIGAEIAANWTGAYECFQELYSVAIAAAPEAKQ